MRYPNVMSEHVTLDEALRGRSIARFGDGEIRLAMGGQAASQKAVPRLRSELAMMLRTSRALVCIPNLKSDTPEMWFWKKYTDPRMTAIYDHKRQYGSTWIARSDCAPWIDNADYWYKMQGLWRGKRVVLVTGERKCFTPEEMREQGALHVEHVSGPRTDAYAEVDALEVAIVRAAVSAVAHSIILSLGACATVLAERLARRGVHAVDLGHAGMFMRRAANRFKKVDLISTDYRDQLVQHHAVKSNNWGKHGHVHADHVHANARRLKCESVLDFGCGQGTLKRALLELGWRDDQVFEYDPGIPGKEAMPAPADYLVCTDVLEHVEPDRLRPTLQIIKALARKGMFLQIAMKPAKDTLPDGRNAHLITKKAEWWLDELKRHWLTPKTYDTQKGLRVWIER